MQYTETQLTKLIEDVEKEFTAHLAKAEDTDVSLAKAEDGEKKPEHKPEEENQDKPEHKPEQKPEGEGHQESAPPQEGAAPEAKPEGNPAEMQAHPDHDYDADDLEHLHKMYMSMSEGERKVHHDAIMKCGMMKSDDAMCTETPGKLPGKQSPASHSHPDVQKAEHSDGLIKPSEPKGSPGAKSPASSGQKNLNNMEKGEHTRQSGGKISTTGEPKGSPGAKAPATKSQGNLSDMEKSEQGTETELLKSELTDVKGKYDELKKNFDGVAAFLSKLLEKKSAPAAKAITSLDAITKSEGAAEEKTLTKSEIDSTLLRKSQDPSTSKADRDAINAYYLSGEGIKSISHLLK